MLINFAQFIFNLLIALVMLKLLEAHLISNNPESNMGQALAFLLG